MLGVVRAYPARGQPTDWQRARDVYLRVHYCGGTFILIFLLDAGMGGWKRSRGEGRDGWLRSYPPFERAWMVYFCVRVGTPSGLGKGNYIPDVGGHEEVERVPNFFSMRFVSSKIFKS